MAALKTRPTDASVDDFIASVEPERRRDESRRLVEIMREVTGEEPVMWGTSIVGFGDYHYRYASGREGDWFVAGFSPRKRALSVYLMAGVERHQDLLDRLGPHTHGSGCLYLRRLDAVDENVLRELIVESVAFLRETYG